MIFRPQCAKLLQLPHLRWLSSLIELLDLAVAAHFLQQRSNAVVRKELAAHLHQQTALLTGYADFLQRNARALLTLCQDRPLLPGASPTAETTITGACRLEVLNKISMVTGVLIQAASCSLLYLTFANRVCQQHMACSSFQFMGMRLQPERSTGLPCCWLRLKRLMMQLKVEAAPWTSLRRPLQVEPSHAGSPRM